MGDDCRESAVAAHHELQLGDSFTGLRASSSLRASTSTEKINVFAWSVASAPARYIILFVQQLSGQYALSASVWPFLSVNPSTRRSDQRSHCNARHVHYMLALIFLESKTELEPLKTAAIFTSNRLKLLEPLYNPIKKGNVGS